ncbi:VaFE repeat-containing surface-anchored protein [Corynebacterium sp. SFY-M4]|uniref:VaFE repeat-containing surface-anchored protein n=1 Tax=Corynebacterium sp. SFY-M4 TaxID=3092265 RepID=UPI00298DC52F|nr:VaFE repeat-containing surface-anchored protein [Corynebacterium sp. SFY-M4]
MADSNTTPSHQRDGRTFTVDTDLARKFAAKWGEAISSQDWQTIASQSGVSDANATNAQLAASMAVWSLQGRPIDRQVVRGHLANARAHGVDKDRTEKVRKIAHAMVSQAENYSASSDEAEPATVKISQGNRTENGDGTVIPISVSGNSDNDKAAIKVDGLPSGAKLTDANGKTVNNGDEVAVPSELKLTVPSGTDPGQAKVFATTTKTSKLPAGTLLKPVGNDDSQWIITLKPSKDVPSNATAGINVKWDKETPSSSSSSSSSSASSSTSASTSAPKPVVPTSSGSESSTTSSSRVTSTSSSTSSDKPSSSTSASESSTSASSTAKVPENHNPKISTTVDVDGKKSAEGNPVKVDASKLHEGINVKDHIDYEGLAPKTKYEFTGTLMKVENGKAKPVFGVKPASVVESVDDSGKGTATVDFGTITDLKPDMQYVVFEKAVPVDKSENPTVKDDGTPKNPDEDNRETVTHEDADDDSQTFVAGEESSTSSTSSSVTSTSSSTAPQPSTSSPTSSTTPKPVQPWVPDSATSTTSPSEAPNDKPKISTTVEVDGKKSNDVDPLMVDAQKAKDGISVKDNIDYQGMKPGTKYKFVGTLMKIEDGQPAPVSNVKPASVVETIGDSGKGTAVVDFGTLTNMKADTQYVVFEKAIPVDDNGKPTVKDDGTPKNPSKDDRETVKHEDSNDMAQTFVTEPDDEDASSTPSPSSTSAPKPVAPVEPTKPSTSADKPDETPNGTPKISTTVDVDGERASEGNPVQVDSAKALKGITVKDHIDYQGLEPNTTYRFTGTLMKVENGKATPVSGVEPASVLENVDGSGKGTATVDFGTLTRMKPGTKYVVVEKAIPVDDNGKPTVKDDGTPKNPSKDDRETVKHEDANDSAQTFVTSPEGKPVPSDSRQPGESGTHPTPGKPGSDNSSETPGKPGQSGTTSSESPAPSTDNGKPGDSEGSDNGSGNGSNGSDNGSNGAGHGSDNGSGSGSDNGSGNGSDNGSGNGSGSGSSHGVGGALASTGANVIWLALLAMVLIATGAGVVLWNRRRSQEG